MDGIHEITGKRLRLRLVEPADAAFIHALRTDPAFNAHLSPVTGTVADQQAWITAYKTREAAGDELYYIIERQDGMPCGTVRLYGITKDSFTWGSWILNADKPPKAALDSALLIYEIGYGVLHKSRAVFDVRADNERVLQFHIRFGSVETGRDAENVYFELTASRFAALRAVLYPKLEA